MRLALTLLALLIALPLPASALKTSAGDVDVTRVAGDLDQPWAIGFLPGGAFLVTERDGVLLHFSADGHRRKVSGVPRVRAEGQGGLLEHFYNDSTLAFLERLGSN